ncbi:hypothetical protein RMATCC62417_14647 [Rhizopus microsporus]|nr:hypothetical protein RMATCC62417_14647 [Rhizopus microsporus]
MALQRIIPSSPVEAHAEGSTNVQTAKNSRSDPGGPLLEGTMLASNGLANDQGALSDHETQQDVGFSRLDIISTHNKSEGFDESSI